MIYIHIDGRLMFATDAPGQPPIDMIPYEGFQPPHPLTYSSMWYSDSDEAYEHRAFIRVLRRISAGEPVMMTMPLHNMHSPWADTLRGLLGTAQGFNMRWMVNTYGCSFTEAMRMLETCQDYMSDPRWPSLFAASVIDSDDLNPPHPTEGITWQFRAKVAGWALAQHGCSSHPVSHAMGYRDSVVQRMEPSGVPHTPEAPPQDIDALQATRFFVDHVEVACKVALDTPQGTTLHLKPTGLEPIRFANVRMSRDVRGLRIILPTGGLLFYRDATLSPGNGSIIYNGRAMPRRKIPFDIMTTMAHDLAITHMERRIIGGEHPALESYEQWRESAPR